MKYDLIIGLDTGKNTGYAIYTMHERRLVTVKTILIHQAMEAIISLTESGNKVKVRFEDARLRKDFGTTGREKLQGAGSIKRDAVIWEDFLKDKKIDHECVAPKNNSTKLTSAYFKALTKWAASTDHHGRDAAMLVYGF